MMDVVQKSGVVFLTILMFGSCSNETDSCTLKGPYLGQTPPGMTPQLFAPGTISTGLWDFNAAFSPDLKQLYFSVLDRPRLMTLFFTEETPQGWSEPQTAPFVSPYSDADPWFSPDGQSLYFVSNRPSDGESAPKKHWDIWVVERSGARWGTPKHLDAPVNLDVDDIYPSLSKNGTLYFASSRPGGYGGRDLYCCKPIDGGFAEAVNLGPAINTAHSESDAMIAPDESYLILASSGREDSFGGSDLYISFHREDGTWTPAQNMEEAFNGRSAQLCPILSPDGKYLFFTSCRQEAWDYATRPQSHQGRLRALNRPMNGNGDIYWVDAKIIETFKPGDAK